MRTIKPEEMAELEKKYAPPDYELLKVELRMGDVVFRNPTPAEYGAFQAMRFNDDTKKTAFPNLMVMCCVFPDRAELERDMKRWPGIASNVKIVRALQYVAGEADEVAGKG